MLAELTLAKLDSTTAPELADKFEVTGFPTMVLFSPDAKPENLKQLGPHNDVFIAAHMANKLLGGLSLRLCASVFSPSHTLVVCQVATSCYSLTQQLASTITGGRAKSHASSSRQTIRNWWRFSWTQRMGCPLAT